MAIFTQPYFHIQPNCRANIKMAKISLQDLSVNTIRTLSIDAVQAAESGHPGMPMGMADAAYVLWTKFLKHDPAHPNWFDRDRFVLSAGHGSMLLYSLLHLTGYDLPLEELKNFRQWDSQTPGHPEYGYTPGVETTTGPLGQGFATGVGMAMAEAHLAAEFNKEDCTLVDHYTYGIVSDGDLMEGISHEAASLAGHLKLGKLIYLYDSNRISIDGSTDLAFTEDVAKRFKAYGWHIQQINGHDREAVADAIENAQSAGTRPSLIVCRTKIGFGSPNKEGSESSHGAPLGEEEIRLTKENLNWDPDKKFYIPEEVKIHFREALEDGEEWYGRWSVALENYAENYKNDFERFENYIERNIPENLQNFLPRFEPDKKGIATRASSGQVINAIEDRIPGILGGSADLTGSTKTWIDSGGIFNSADYTGRNVHYGVREHAMAAAVNGLALHQGIVPFGATFLIFSDYCRPSIRIAALSEIPSIFVFTHDSIGLGEDGPTHQPIEHLASLRAIPNICVIRPADANETAWAWKVAVERTDGPTLLVLTRQNLPTLDRSIYGAAEDLEKGAYILNEAVGGKPDALLLATGSEVQLAMKAQQMLRDDHHVHARVVSMPSWELFQQQDKEYRDLVLPPEVKARVSIEAASTFGWERWVGSEGVAIGLDHFGASAPYKKIYEGFNITPQRMVDEVLGLVK